MGAEFEVWWIPQIPMDAFVVPVPSYEEGARLCEVLANYDLFQFEHNVKPDYCNTGGVRFRDPEITGGEWWDVPEDDEERADLLPVPSSGGRGR